MKITYADIEKQISGEYYFTGAEGVLGGAVIERGYQGADDMPVHPELALLTFCVLRLKNGFTVVGESACVNPGTFDREIGRDIARKDAVRKCWPLLGYEMKTAKAAAQ